MKSQITHLLVLACVAAPLQAQSGDIAVPTARMHWEQLSGYVLASAEDMPEAKYSFAPVKGVRTFGELIGHVAGAQNMFCAIALGQTPPAEDAVEKAATSKAALIAAMKASNANCAKAYAQTDAAARGEISLFGQKRTRLFALMMNATHDGEHYGNLITYLRINGLVPPSSKGN